MAITNILASGSTAASSSDVVVASGSIVTLLCTGPGSLIVEQKTSTGAYRPIGSLHGASNEESSKQATGPITLRVTRNAGQTAGCEKDDGAE